MVMCRRTVLQGAEEVAHMERERTVIRDDTEIGGRF